MPEYIHTDDYEIRLLAGKQTYMQIIDTKTGNCMHITISEAVDMLTLMYRYRYEMQMLKFGE